jgi:hypothetical protein
MRIHAFSSQFLLIAHAAVLLAAPVLAGEPAAATAPVRFQRFVINDDPTYTGMEVSRGVMPGGWKLKGGVVWDLRDGFPAQFRIHIGDAEDVAAFDIYPDQHCFWSTNAAQNRNFPPGSRYMGSVVQAPPADQFQALTKVILPRYRPDLAQARIVDQQKMPKVAEAAFRAMAQNPGYQYWAMAGRMRFEYELHGQAVQEDMYVVVKLATNLRLHFTNWVVESVTSTRGPKGTLEQLNTLRALMTQAIQPNIAWYNKVTQFILIRQKMTLQKLAAQEERRKIFMKLKEEISEENKQAFENHMHDIDVRSNAFADYTREVSPYRTGDGKTVKLPNKYGMAFEGANGEILLSNEPGYNPNSDPNQARTTWTPLQQVPR